MTLDHGPLSGIRRRSTPRQRSQYAAGIERTVDAAVAEVKAAKEAGRQEEIAAYREKNKPVPFSTAELQTAVAVRTSTGWHRVVKVNTKSVTVETGYSWTDRYPINKILEVK